MNDANGFQIKIGDKVKHKFPPCNPTQGCPAPAGQRFCCHNFAGTSTVKAFVGKDCIEIKKVGQNHIPVMLAEFAVLVP